MKQPMFIIKSKITLMQKNVQQKLVYTWRPIFEALIFAFNKLQTEARKKENLHGNVI